MDIFEQAVDRLLETGPFFEPPEPAEFEDEFESSPALDEPENMPRRLPRRGAPREDLTTLPGVKVERQKGPYVFLHVTDPESLATIGRRTYWDTRDEKYANTYLKHYGVIYVVLKNGKPYLQATPDLKIVVDLHDRALKSEEVRQFLWSLSGW
jgi:hypothetical protein